MKKFAMHVHTAPLSPCAQVLPEEAARLYKNMGYDGIFVTNHFMKWVLTEYYSLPKEKIIEHYLSGYRRVKEAAKPLSMQVFLGLELNLEPYNNKSEIYPISEVLVYGLTEEILIANQNLFDMTIEELFEFCNSHNALCFQSHPFRNRVLTLPPQFLHGVEVYNANPRHNSNNGVAEKFAKDNNLLTVASDDFHEYGDEGRATTLFPDDCKELKDYIAALREGRTKILI